MKVIQTSVAVALLIGLAYSTHTKLQSQLTSECPDCERRREEALALSESEGQNEGVPNVLSQADSQSLAQSDQSIELNLSIDSSARELGPIDDIIIPQINKCLFEPWFSSDKCNPNKLCPNGYECEKNYANKYCCPSGKCVRNRFECYVIHPGDISFDPIPLDPDPVNVCREDLQCSKNKNDIYCCHGVCQDEKCNPYEQCNCDDICKLNQDNTKCCDHRCVPETFNCGQCKSDTECRITGQVCCEDFNYQCVYLEDCKSRHNCKNTPNFCSADEPYCCLDANGDYYCSGKDCNACDPTTGQNCCDKCLANGLYCCRDATGGFSCNEKPCQDCKATTNCLFGYQCCNGICDLPKNCDSTICNPEKCRAEILNGVCCSIMKGQCIDQSKCKEITYQSCQSQGLQICITDIGDYVCKKDCNS